MSTEVVVAQIQNLQFIQVCNPFRDDSMKRIVPQNSATYSSHDYCRVENI